MEIESISLIVIITYLLGEIYKVAFKKKQKFYKLIPVVVTIVGGIMGIIIFITEPSMIKANNIYYALEIGLISGASSTGINQIFKKIKGENVDG